MPDVRMLEKIVMEELTGTLGLDFVDSFEITPNMTMDQLGLDSLDYMDLACRIEKRTGVFVDPVNQPIHKMTVGQIARSLLQEVPS